MALSWIAMEEKYELRLVWLQMIAVIGLIAVIITYMF